MKFFTLLFIGLCLLFIGCSPKPIYELKPYDEQAEYEAGRLVAIKIDSTHESAVNFETQMDDHLVFFTYFYNSSDEPFTINPADFYLKTYNNKEDYEKDRKFLNLPAYDPEKEILRAAEDYDDAEGGFDAMTGLNCLFGAIGLISAADDDDESTGDAVETVLIWTDNQMSIEEGRDEAYLEFEMKKQLWQNEVLRKTKLYNDEEVGGMIHFPINHESKYSRLFIKAGSKHYFFSFEQFQINK